MHVYDAQRKHIPLAQELARNEEAVVYRVQHNSMFVVKLYRTPSAEREQKLAWMIGNPPYDPNQTCGHTSIAWPHWMIYDEQGKWVGYALDYIENNRTMRNVFDPQLRARNNFDGRYVYRSARYLAASLQAIHTPGYYVVGNLNPDDILVTPTSRITIIAIDSIQAQEHRGGQTVLHSARTGKPGYMPPEFLARGSQPAQLQPEHDLFALGVIIFQLLMDGHHPFDGQWQGAGTPPTLDERIQQGLFPYAEGGSTALLPPPGASLSALPPVLVDMVRRCFCDGHANSALRPSAEAWEQALDVAEQGLVLCQKGHVYSNHLAVCPTCGAPPADEKTARRLSEIAPEPAPVCPPMLPTASRQSFWFWPVVASVVVLIVVALLVGGSHMVTGA